MAVQNWSPIASQNTTVDGINIAENCPPGNINNAIRAVMASVRVMYSELPAAGNASTFMPKSGGAFTGNPTYNGRGGYLHFADPGLTSGRIFVQADGGTPPAMSNGDILIEY